MPGPAVDRGPRLELADCESSGGVSRSSGHARHRQGHSSGSPVAAPDHLLACPSATPSPTRFDCATDLDDRRPPRRRYGGQIHVDALSVLAGAGAQGDGRRSRRSSASSTDRGTRWCAGATGLCTGKLPVAAVRRIGWSGGGASSTRSHAAAVRRRRCSRRRQHPFRTSPRAIPTASRRRPYFRQLRTGHHLVARGGRLTERVSSVGSYACRIRARLLSVGAAGDDGHRVAAEAARRSRPSLVRDGRPGGRRGGRGLFRAQS